MTISQRLTKSPKSVTLRSFS